MTPFRHVKTAADTVAQMLTQALILTAVTVLFVLSGYAARQGLQSLAMLALSTGVVATRLKGDARWFAAGGAGLIAAAAVHIAFGLAPDSRLAFPETLLAGAGSWVLIGVALILRGDRKQPFLRRRPDAWRWLVGAATWLGIAVTYASPTLALKTGAFASYLWIPWATAGAIVGAVVLPWAMTKKLPPLGPATRAWATGTVRSVATILVVGVAVGFVMAQLAPAIAGGVSLAAACDGCPPDRQVLALRVLATPEGILLAGLFAAPPTEARVHLEGLAAPIMLARTAEGGWLAAGNGTVLKPGAIAVAVEDATLLILLMDPELRLPAALEGPDGNRAPREGWATPTRA